ncbi:MAG: type I-E CRISPR-associated protein Cas5/CasD, partial [Candidatus Magnetominusculus sp. LBB02]|nr:type I-E CRISPR-associated protein Cas5/CasD [Candidatus Magnetominusculus sp. LBB02]
MSLNTLFLRLEGHMQAWGDQQSKFVVRRTAEAPTKSGILGMLCAAMGVSRPEAVNELPRLRTLNMGVRIDKPGIRWWDYHTVGAGMQMRIADGKTKLGAMLTRREYLCDASFLAALQGEPDIIDELIKALEDPKWTLYLGRKSCPPSRPMLELPAYEFPDLLSALRSIPWCRRLKSDDPPPYVDCSNFAAVKPVHKLKSDDPPPYVDCLLDWRPTHEEPEAPNDALIWYDVPLTFEPPSHSARFVIRRRLLVGTDGEIAYEKTPVQSKTPPQPRPRANYQNTEYKRQRIKRLDNDCHLCVFCKSPATTVQHITYRRAGGNESIDDLRTLCRLCHDAVTMLEYGLGMGMDRINPEEPQWRD